MARGDEEPVVPATDVHMAAPSDDEEAIRAKLRETGWKKRKEHRESDERTTPSSASGAAASDERRRRDRESSRRAHRDDRGARRSSKSTTATSRRRSRSASKSRSASRDRRPSSSSRRRRASKSRSASSARKSASRAAKPREKDDTDTDPEVADEIQRAKTEPTTRDPGAAEAMDPPRGGPPLAVAVRIAAALVPPPPAPVAVAVALSLVAAPPRGVPLAFALERPAQRPEPAPAPQPHAKPEPQQLAPPPPALKLEGEAQAPVAPTAAPLPLPTAGVNPTITQLMQQHPTLSLQEIIAKMQASSVSQAAAAAQKPARELYVGNLPPNVSGPQLQEFLSTIVLQVGLTTQPGNPIVNTWLSTDGHFAFCEMRSVEECTLALLLNQLPLLGQPLKFGRPRSYMGPPLPFPLISERAQAALLNLGCVPNPAYFSTTGLALSAVPPVAAMAPPVAAATPAFQPTSAPVAAPVAPPALVAAPAPAPPAADATSTRLLMSNIPLVLVEAQVRELVEPFGTLKSFTLLQDAVTGASTGTAVFEYELAGVADEALQGLNGLDIGGIPLSLRRAPQDANAAVAETSDVVKLANMVSIDELNDDDEFSDLKEDVEEECKRFGKVVNLVIPRPQEGESVPGVGSIFVRFSDVSEATAALKALSGRKFGGNIVKVTYYPLARFEAKDFA
ncbi:hypothetical protein PybrP1_007949 [[Pythium] brassicae (nom. inval.)]|nr:hypothetical protein PybrP1_007949 [[Pythium] brassicae (nom. inval.)]